MPPVNLWLALSDPYRHPNNARGQCGTPFRALLDTGFDDTLLLSATTLVTALGARLPSNGPDYEGWFARASGRLYARRYGLNLWGHCETHGPHAAHAAPADFLRSNFPVWVSMPTPGASGPPPTHPPLIGRYGLQLIEAVLNLDYRTFLCDLQVEAP